MKQQEWENARAYSSTKLAETAQTFRCLAQAYEQTATTREKGAFSRQLFLVANVLEECVNVQSKKKEIQIFSRKQIKGCIRTCFKEGIRIRNFETIQNEDGKIQIYVQAKSIGAQCISTRRMIQIFQRVFQVMMCADSKSEPIIYEKFHQYIFTQADRFQVLSGIARMNQVHQEISGDNFLLQQQSCGKVVAAIADGMGSGRKAFAESRRVIELLEQCMDARMQERQALELVNLTYIQAGKMGNPVTVDFSVIDCQTGYLQCMKLGAVATFIKRNTGVEFVRSTTLPMGVLEQIDVDYMTKKLYDGDYVIMMSDGILENLPVLEKEAFMADIIEQIDVREPHAMASRILKMSVLHHNMEPSDDCTVLVLGVFDTYDK